MTCPRVIDWPSPNREPRRGSAGIDMLIVHYTGMPRGDEALARLCNPAAKVSAHYLIEEDGRIFALVPESERAWHAGEAYWAGDEDINSRSIGIELVNPGHEHGYRPFAEPQMQALEALARGVIERHRIPVHRVLGHSDVAPERKTDPGELFDWARLAQAGIGYWPVAELAPQPGAQSFRLSLGDRGGEVAAVQDALARFGYRPAGNRGHFDAGTAATVSAFQRHFRPRRVDGILDRETLHILAHLLVRATVHA